MMEADNDSSLLHEMFEKALKDPEDEFAVSMFATMIRSDSRFVSKAIKLILDKIILNSIPESLRSLEILEECMSRSGVDFQSEISKFRFLNELSKLVSIKHMGNKTLKEIKDKIMDCFLLWTAQYPEKEKIKTVYDSLKKEGAHDTTSSGNVSVNCVYQRKTNLMDEENEKKFRRLLQSTNKEDVKKANLLIQHLVKQDGKKAERVSKQKAELKEIQTTVQVFTEVVDNYLIEKPENEDATLLEELYETCTKYKHIVGKMPDIMEDSEEELIRDTMRVNDMLLEVLEKYKMLTVTNGSEETKNLVSSSVNNILNSQLEDLLSVPLEQPKIRESISNEKNPLDELADIFSPSLPSSCLTPAPVAKAENIEDSTLLELKPTELSSPKSVLSAIDDLSADLFNKELNSLPRVKTFGKENSKFSLNQLSKVKQKIISEVELEKNILSDNISDSEKSSVEKVEEKDKKEIQNISVRPENEKLSSSKKRNESERSSEVHVANSKINTKINYLSEIEIHFDEIEPSNAERIILFDCKDGLRVTLDFATNKPFEYTSVIVVSSTNQSQLPIDDFQFDAFVHKPCKLRLLQRNGNFLSGVKPFCPPSDCLHQIMLIYNPTEKPLDVTFTYSYKEGEDPDPIKGSVMRSIPYLK